ncbi:GTP-binding protein [Leptolyngbya sp. FACHB-261]|uniref:GTP-binding protein n=1 Tax=Leptolyngbya sp. FACHB-261 TaxID=2692806 RepID=UPI0028C49D4A|nr:GTP-binding protein [Leptolyngbya sp. FACHB-261]
MSSSDSLNPTHNPAEDELDSTILSFADIQEELNYKQAQKALREIVDQLDLSPSERAGLEPELEDLQVLLEKLDHQVVHIVVFGMVGRGKSSLLNALLGRNIFETGPIHGVTRESHSAQWTVSREALGSSDHDILRVALRGLGDSRIELIDTPGIDEVDGEAREALAQEIAQQADLILFMVSGDITKVEYEALSRLRQASKPILLVFNKIDQYPDADREAIYQKIRDDRVRELLSPNEIVMAAASPLIAKAVRRPDGSLGVSLLPGPPEVNDLKLKILEILHREGKSLVALNTMLFVDNVNDHIVQRKLEIRDARANKLIWNATLTKAAAIALNPVTVMDVIGGAVVDVALILGLSKLYGINMTQQGAVGLLQKIAIGMGGISASELLANLGMSSLKGLLGLAVPVTGGTSLAAYASVALTQAGVAGVSSYAIGMVAKEYLANGASWGPSGPKAVVTRILENLDEGSILSRIRTELQAKIDWRQRAVDKAGKPIP